MALSRRITNDTAVQTAWDRFITVANARARNAKPLDEVMAFFVYKTRAVNAARAELIKLSDKAGSAVIAQQPASGDRSRVTVSDMSFDDKAAFRVRVFFDLYLFELSSVRDALYQIVNAAFVLGLPAEEVTLAAVLPLLKLVTKGAATGLEEWQQLTKAQKSWLSALVNLRNTATHRNLVQTDPTIPSLNVGGESPTQGTVQLHFWIVPGDGTREPLVRFMDRNEREMDRLLDRTFIRLTELLEAAA